MRCIKCKNELPEEAKFCSYCGAAQEIPQPAAKKIEPQPAVKKIEPQPAAKKIEPQPAPKKVEPQPAAMKSAPQPSVQQTISQPTKKKSKLGGFVRVLIIAGVVYAASYGFSYYIASNKNSGGNSTNTTTTTTTTTTTSGNSVGDDNAVSDPFGYVSKGALYQDGILRYGPIEMDLPGYVKSDVSTETNDYLVTLDNSNIVSVTRKMEIMVSFDNSDEEGILDSYNDGSDDAGITYEKNYFDKFYIGDFPVIVYSVYCPSDGSYITEAIVLNKESATESARVIIYSSDENAQKAALADMATLRVNTTKVETNVYGIGRISTGDEAASDQTMTTPSSTTNTLQASAQEYVTVGRYNLRSTPNGDVIKTLDEGTTCYMIAKGVAQNWVQIQLEDGTQGWIYADGIRPA